MADNKSNSDSKRQEFLFHMYDQMFNDINRHINIIWQPITVLVGSVGLIAFGERAIIPKDIAISFIIILVGWLIANIYDAAYWYNRDLAIIANIERQFLKQSDIKDVHYYFGEHRSKKNPMLTHMRIQWVLGIFISVIVLLYHLSTRVISAFQPTNTLCIEMAFPYITALVTFVLVLILRNKRIKSYENFRRISPGIKMDNSEIPDGEGHPVDKPKKKDS